MNVTGHGKSNSLKCLPSEDFTSSFWLKANTTLRENMKHFNEAMNKILRPLDATGWTLYVWKN